MFYHTAWMDGVPSLGSKHYLLYGNKVQIAMQHIHYSVLQVLLR